MMNKLEQARRHLDMLADDAWHTYKHGIQAGNVFDEGRADAYERAALIIGHALETQQLDAIQDQLNQIADLQEKLDNLGTC